MLLSWLIACKQKSVKVVITSGAKLVEIHLTYATQREKKDVKYSFLINLEDDVLTTSSKLEFGLMNVLRWE